MDLESMDQQSMDQKFILVISNLPDRASAEALAGALIQARAAACVNIMAPCHSVYRWQGELETKEETPLFIKTTAARYADVERIIRDGHPYELPEILSIELQQGLPEYLSWLNTEAKPA